MELDELADLMDIPTEDLLTSILKQARFQEGFDFNPNLPDEVLERMVASSEVSETSKNWKGAPGSNPSTER